MIMKLKSYLKGLGTGIIFALSLCLIIQLNTKTMSDEDVIKRAKELGLTESTTLSDSSALTKYNNVNDESSSVGLKVDNTEDNKENEDIDNPNLDSSDSESPSVTDIESDDEKVKQTENESDDEKANQSEKDSEVSSTDAKEEDIKDNESSDNKTVTVIISPGQGSETVSSNVQSAGLVDDATKFNKFLCDNGYDKKLRVGSHEIPVGADEKTIADILCGQ